MHFFFDRRLGQENFPLKTLILFVYQYLVFLFIRMPTIKNKLQDQLMNRQKIQQKIGTIL